MPPADAAADGAEVCVPRDDGLEICGDGEDNDCREDTPDECGCDAYVELDGSDDGGGTMLDPTREIGQGIAIVDAMGGGVVCVAGNDGGDDCGSDDFREDVIMRDRVSVKGGFRIVEDDWALDHGCRPSLDGFVTFGATVSEGTRVEKFIVRPRRAESSFAVQFEGSGTLVHNKVVGPASTDSYGVRVVRSAATVPVIADNTIEGGRGPDVMNSYGVFVERPGLRVRNNQRISGGTANVESIGVLVHMVDMFEISDNDTISGGAAPVSIGVRTISSGGIIVGTRRIFGQPVPAMSTPQSEGTGIQLRCEAARREVVVVGHDLIAGAKGETANGHMSHGVYVEGCTATIVDNDTVVGSTDGAIGGDGAYGVLVSGARAFVANNESIYGCDSGRAECDGLAAWGNSNVDVDRNQFSVSHASIRATSINVRGSVARIRNNLVRVGENGIGIRLWLNMAGTTEDAQTRVLFNTVVWPASELVMRPDGQPILMTMITEGGVPPSAIVANNNFYCERHTEGTAIDVHATSARPLIFHHNNLYCGALYRKSEVYREFSLFQGLESMTPGYGGNLSVTPDFADNYRLNPSSPLVGEADPEYPLDDDIDGDARPQGDGYDIGCDEVVP